MSTVPTKRSSVTPSGICTKGASFTSRGTSPPPIRARRSAWRDIDSGRSVVSVRPHTACRLQYTVSHLASTHPLKVGIPPAHTSGVHPATAHVWRGCAGFCPMLVSPRGHPASRVSSMRAKSKPQRAHLPLARVVWVGVADAAAHHLYGRQQRVQPPRQDRLQGEHNMPCSGIRAATCRGYLQPQMTCVSSSGGEGITDLAGASLPCYADAAQPCEHTQLTSPLVLTSTQTAHAG